MIECPENNCEKSIYLLAPNITNSTYFANSLITIVIEYLSK